MSKLDKTVAEVFKSKFLQIAGLGLIGISCLLAWSHPKELWGSFLTSGFFWLSILLGSLFFVNHLDN